MRWEASDGISLITVQAGGCLHIICLDEPPRVRIHNGGSVSYWGVAELPLHEGRVPRWMAERMKRLLKAILEVIVEEKGPDWLVERLADPFWFQALNNVIGMDWDSSGSTTVLTGLLKEVTSSGEYGVMVAGGKGRRAIETPRDLEVIGEKLSVSSRRVEELKLYSRLAAATDSSLLQDGFQLYHHVVIVSESGRWVIIQQGMNIERKMARRYHIPSSLFEKREPTLEPHSGIVSRLRLSRIPLDLTSSASREARRVITDLASERPERVKRMLAEAIALAKGVKPLLGEQDVVRRLRVYKPPFPPPDPRRVEPVLRKLYEVKPRSIEEVVLIRGVGPATLRALALISELIFGVEVSHRDPATDPLRYAFAVGGKDGYPFPFNPRIAEETAAILEDAVRRAKLGDRARLEALRRLHKLLARFGEERVA